MTTILMLHGARQRPHVWRAVSDNFPPEWGVIAPQLHGKKTLADMNQTIVQDLGRVHVDLPILVVASGEGLIPAAEFCACNADSGDIAGLLITEPCIAVTAHAARWGNIQAALLGKVAKPRTKRAALTDASLVQRASFLAALQGSSAQENLLTLREAGIMVRILAGEKNRAGLRQARQLAELIPHAEFFPIGMAEWDWNAYAPANFAANLLEFADKIIEG